MVAAGVDVAALEEKFKKESNPSNLALESAAPVPSSSPSMAFFSSGSSAPAQTIRLAEDGLWPRCVELKNLLGLSANSADISETPILTSREAQQKYVNMIAFIEASLERNGGILSAEEVELIRQAITIIRPFILSIPDGRVISRDSVKDLFSEVEQFGIATEIEPNIVLPSAVPVLSP